MITQTYSYKNMISTEISLESLEDELERLASTQGLTVTTLMNYFILLH